MWGSGGVKVWHGSSIYYIGFLPMGFIVGFLFVVSILDPIT